MNFNSLYTSYYNDFLHEFGERKIRKIAKTITDSKHTLNMLNQLKKLRLPPNATTLRQCILSNFSLSFASKSTELFAMVFLLKKWNDEVNINNIIASETEVCNIFSNLNRAFTY